MEKLLEIIESDKISWKKLLFEAVKEGKLNPWDIDICMLAKIYIKKIESLELDLKKSGKVLLVATILLLLKAKRILEEKEEEKEEKIEELTKALEEESGKEAFIDLELAPKTPVPRKRKISVFELVKALESALEIKRRHAFFKKTPVQLEIPTLDFNLKEELLNFSNRLKEIFSHKNFATFNFLKNCFKYKKIYLLLLLLHLLQKGEIALEQASPFSEIKIIKI